MVLDKLILDNFLTYDHLEYEFEKKPLLIQGLNLTDDDQKTNGTGKSGIQTGIEFCITAQNSRDVRDSELITYGFNEARTQLFVSCDVRKESIHIDWTIKIKGSNLLTFRSKSYDSDEWISKSFSTVLDGKKYILDWFAISKEDLFNYFIINNSRFKSFFKSSNKEKVDLINRFSDASIIKGLENIDNSELEGKLNNAQREFNSTEGKIELIKSQINKEQNRNFKDEMEESVSEIKGEIKDTEENISIAKSNIESKFEEIKNIKEVSIVNLKKEILVAHKGKNSVRDLISFENKIITSIANDLNQASNIVEQFIITDWDKNRESVNKIIDANNLDLIQRKEVKSTREKQSTSLLKLLENINVKLSGSITCPSCQHEFVLEGNIEELKEKKESIKKVDLKLSEALLTVQNLINDSETAISLLVNDLSSINKKETLEISEKRKLQDKVDEINVKLEEHKNTLRNLGNDDSTYNQKIIECNNKIDKQDIIITGIEGKIENQKNKIKNYEVEIVSYGSIIKDLKLGDNVKYINTLKEDLKSLEVSLTTNNDKIVSINDSIYERNQWVANFKQFRMYLANQSLEVIQYHCNRYLTDMGSDMKVKMEGFKVLANGTYKEEITAKIIRDRERTFSSFSGGEKGRLLFASILANRHMINDTHPYGGFDFLAIDEVFEGVDSMGLKNIVSSAKILNVPVMIITHVTDEEANSDRLLIVKENGISKIKQE